MKITKDHYLKLASACADVLAKHPNMRERYQAAGFSDMRFNWEVLRLCHVGGKKGMDWVCEELYPYLYDSHINTALARILCNSGTDSKGRRNDSTFLNPSER
jgi:hypothetical protein